MRLEFIQCVEGRHDAECTVDISGPLWQRRQAEGAGGTKFTPGAPENEKVSGSYV
jgi:hypothetical protein